MMSNFLKYSYIITCKFGTIFIIIGQGILPFIMVTLGANFRLERSKFIYAIIYSFLKFTAGVLIALLLIKVLILSIRHK